MSPFVWLSLLNAIDICRAISGIVWNASNQTFVPLFSIGSFSRAKDRFSNRFRSIEYHNFRKEVLVVSYYQEGRSKESNIVNFVDNDTRITGVCGDIWTTLADYLNFTLVPIKLENKNFGNELENGTFDGLLGLIQQNQSQIIPRAGAFASRLNLVEYTVPLWTIRYHLYVLPEWKHDEIWMIHLFSMELWYCVFVSLLALSLAGYAYEKISTITAREPIRCNLQDHIIYTIAIASSQGFVPPEVHKKSRIIYICTSMFSWIILIAFSSHAIYLMMNRKYVLPFAGLKDLIQTTKYDVIAFNGSMVHQDFENLASRYYKHVRDFQRVSFAPAARDLYEKVCFSKKHKYAAFEAADRHNAIGRRICPRLVPSWESYFETWISAAIKKGFPYKRSFDVGILKMIEFGLIDALKARWLNWQQESNREAPFQSIDISQVYLIFGIWMVGISVSFFLLFVENLLMLIRIRSSKRNVKRRLPPFSYQNKSVEA
ncbi:glutamate receptor ionotropic, kainate glr-3-like [Phymastichus coffea]|uniref:glutamate receptor ionotropic, kainate glr-3-like n=1 Tax=Phymastichus coffea TaxID=108790 RepID=UPI00273BEAAC|nr:glutamate receptor ionotropic, kainate glr-3-like [Phymastichus coffea]